MKKFLTAIAVMGSLSLAFVGCGGGGNSSDSMSSDELNQLIHTWAWRFKNAAEGQGFPGAAAYTPGNSVTVHPLYKDESHPDWEDGTGFDGEIIPPERIPPSETLPPPDQIAQSTSLVQLVMSFVLRAY